MSFYFPYLNLVAEIAISAIKSIHKYLESKEEIGKVQSLYSFIDTADQINNQKLSVFELSVLYNEMPDNYKNDLLKPYLSINNNMVKFLTQT